MEKITSVKNPMVKDMRALKDRKAREAAGMFLVEGEVMIREAMKCGLAIHDVLADENCEAFAATLESKARVCLTTRSVLEAVCDTRTPQGVCATFSMPVPLSVEMAPDTIVALDGVQDPGNVGTIWRTADAAGFKALLLGSGSADPLSPKVQRSAMGSGFRVPFMLSENLSQTLRELAAKGYTIIASDLNGCDFYSRPDPGKKYVLIIGNEARGISNEVRASADMLVKLPMRGGAESLNAAVAAGIMMYDLARVGSADGQSLSCSCDEKLPPLVQAADFLTSCIKQ